MGPIIKIHAVPQDFRGINNVLHKQSIEAPDITFSTEQMFPIEEAVDLANTGTQALFEPNPIYKIKFNLVSGNRYRSYINAHLNKDIVKNIGLSPKVFLKEPSVYYNNEVWSYTFIPPLTSTGEVNYTVNGDSIYINFDTQNKEVYVSFFYFESNNYTHPATSNVRHTLCSRLDDFVAFAPVTFKEDGVSVSGDFNHDSGSLLYPNRVAGKIYTVTGYHHTWLRLLNEDSGALLFEPGENILAQISTSKRLVKDFTESGPWYLYADIKISNESLDSDLEKFFVKPVLRGKTNAQGFLLEGWNGYIDPQRPWDSHLGQAAETVGYEGLFQNSTSVCSFSCWDQDFCWASGVNPYAINAALPSGIDAANHFESAVKFKHPCDAASLPPLITFYRSTKRTPDGMYAFCNSQDVAINGGGSWLQQNPIGGRFKMLRRGAFSLDGFPVPDSVYCRCLYTMRNFNYVPGMASSWSTNPQFVQVSESDGDKAWTIEVAGAYYDA